MTPPNQPQGEPAKATTKARGKTTTSGQPPVDVVSGAGLPLNAPNSPRDPATTPDTDDPGDSTQQNFRYQHAFGVILMAQASAGTRDYVAIWCEHHEDFLGERLNGTFDGFQIKTRRPETGTWRMNTDDVVRSVGRFVDLLREFGDKIGGFYFVTNTEFDRCGETAGDDKRRGRRPEAFLRHVKGCAAHSDIAAPYKAAFDELRAGCGCLAIELFAVLKRMDLVLGPGRDSFHAVVAHEHLTTVPGCGELTRDELDGWRDRLIAEVYKASSLAVTDPIRHLDPLIGGLAVAPAMSGKKLTVATLMVRPPPGTCTKPFRFTAPPKLQLGSASNPSVLKAKLNRGGIGDQFEYLSERERDTELYLMEEATKAPESSPELLRRLEQVVLGECSEAHLTSRTDDEKPFGRPMMVSVLDRLKTVAVGDGQRVGYQSYDCLVGMVGLLTSDCRVWWSARFAIQEAAA